MTNDTTNATTGRWAKSYEGRWNFLFGRETMVSKVDGATIDLGAKNIAAVIRINDYDNAVRCGEAKPGEWRVILYINGTACRAETFSLLRDAKRAVERWAAGGVLTYSAW